MPSAYTLLSSELAFNLLSIPEARWSDQEIRAPFQLYLNQLRGMTPAVGIHHERFRPMPSMLFIHHYEYALVLVQALTSLLGNQRQGGSWMITRRFQMGRTVRSSDLRNDDLKRRFDNVIEFRKTNFTRRI